MIRTRWTGSLAGAYLHILSYDSPMKETSAAQLAARCAASIGSPFLSVKVWKIPSWIASLTQTRSGPFDPDSQNSTEDVIGRWQWTAHTLKACWKIVSAGFSNLVTRSLAADNALSRAASACSSESLMIVQALFKSCTMAEIWAVCSYLFILTSMMLDIGVSLKSTTYQVLPRTTDLRSLNMQARCQSTYTASYRSSKNC